MLPSPGLQAGREGKVKRGVERAKKRDWPLLKSVPQKVVARVFVRFGSAPVAYPYLTGGALTHRTGAVRVYKNKWWYRQPGFREGASW